MDGDAFSAGGVGQQVDESLANHRVGVLLPDRTRPIVARALFGAVFRCNVAEPEVRRGVLAPCGAVELCNRLLAQGFCRCFFATGAQFSDFAQVEQGEGGLCARVWRGFFVPAARGGVVGSAGVPLAEAELRCGFARVRAVLQVLADGFVRGGTGDGAMRQRRQFGGL